LRGLATLVDTIESLTGAGKGVSLPVNEPLDFEGEFDIAATVEALPGTALVGLELRKLRLPEPQDIGFYATDAGDVSDLEIEAVGDGGRVDSAFSGEV
jgi:hypothetical protein